jgi:hypothetical protein
MDTTDSPSVEPSEPVEEERFLDAVLEKMKDSSSPTVISINYVRDLLLARGLDVDEEGFIIDKDSRELVEPYTFDSEMFSQIESPVEDPLEAYCRPETECEMIIGAKEKVHLSDLHTVYTFDGEPHPVRDYGISLNDLLRKTGMTFNHVCEWSDSANLVQDSEEPTTYISLDSDAELNLNCFNCKFEGEPTTWSKDDESERGSLRCPECNCLWQCFGIEVCTACQTRHRWEDITSEGGGGKYWEPACPDCGAEGGYLHKESRYSDFENEESVYEDCAESSDDDFEYLEQAKAFEQRNNI